ncbi:hypothetical protein KPH14_007761 [Odynerus spinipes]|uniref:PIPK domain-containing protein n=1 Tax=Odynerus spinipes TaxID=1348599 RepID=A0AAD9RK65_9HYME|nr:hypothetical protein KPH14_007761 [Odynerus spinipes]
MASGDNVDAIEVVETSFAGPGQPAEDSRRAENSAEEDNKSTGEKVTALDNSITQHGTAGLKTPAGVSRNKSERERKIGHRRVGVGGEITYKKIQTTQIMGSIQLGIQHAVGGLASKPERDLLMQDFMTVETTNFPSEGSNHTPAHHFSEFKFKNYAPIAFRYFRDLFGIQPDDFLMSMCSAPLRELSNPGASGSIFYLTEDDEFIIKTVQHKEGEFLQTLLPGYYMNLNQNPRTLLPKFFGLYCYRCNSKNVRLVAMNNLLPSAVKLHQKYDLKGSTYKRKASKIERSKSSPTYKDLDFMEHHPEGIFLEADTYNALVKTIQRDCRVLESFKIMDYSLLVGIHNLDQAAREKAQEQRISASADDEAGELAGESGAFIQAEREQRERDDRIGATALNRSRSINRQRLVAHSTAMESIQAESEPIDEEDDVPPGGIPARNARGERLLLFLGIIDILQSYRLKKKLEHTWKSMIHDGDTVSVHRPGFYAQRFQDFMAKTVFKKIPSLDLPEIKGNHRKFRNLVTSYIALKHSPSKRKSITRPLRPLEGDFDSTAVAATGTSTMHATSPTKPGSPTDIVPSTTSTAISSSSIPIATSTPVNLATGPASPPPLALSITQVVPHQEQNALGGGGGIASGKPAAGNYPAVLKGRSAASPPNPNLVPSGKVPPPVPPRGSGSRSARSPGPTTTSSSSITSSRGDEAALNTSRQYRLHESSTLLHHRPLPYSTTSTSSTTATATTTIVTPTTIITTTITTTTTTSTDYNDVIMSAANYEALHARASIPAFLPPGHENLPLIDELVRDRGVIVEQEYQEEVEENAVEEEEFVSVEQVDDSYVIRTSPYPFRPERGNYRSIDRATKALRSPIYPASNLTRETPEFKGKQPVDHMAKFTYFINPASREDLMNYKMSRKDKKHSETYYERMKRKQKEIEASITTITSIARRDRSSAPQPAERNQPSKIVATAERYSTGPAPVVARTNDQNPPKVVEIRKESRLLRKIKERSLKKKKRLAPVPTSKKQADRDVYETGQKKIMREIERVSLRKDSSASTYVDGRASCDNVSSDIQSLEMSYCKRHIEEKLRSRYYEQVDQEMTNPRKNIRLRETSITPMASTSSKGPKLSNSLTGFAMRESHLMVVRSGHEEMTILRDRGGTLPSTCSTPPPPFDDAVRSNDQTLASGGHLQQAVTTTILTSSLSSAHSKQNKVVHHVTLTKTYHDAVSISDVHLESSGSGSGSGGRETKSSLSVESGGSSRGGGGLTWTPPAGSAEGSTPTWTEGTPSFTESSSSGDIGCPTTPIRGSQRSEDGGRIAATVEEALASLTTEMTHL